MNNISISEQIIDTGISVIIPVFRGNDWLEELILRLAKTLPELSEVFEVIFICDGSPDRSWQTIQNLAKEYPWVHGINMMRNYGQHNATLCGVRLAKFDITVTMDDDLQHQPEDIKHLVAKLNDGFDVVYGAPRKLPQSFFRNVMTRITKNMLAFIMGIPSVKNISAFRAFRTHLRNAFENFQSPNVTLDVLLSWGTTRFTSIPVSIEEPRSGTSNYNMSSLFKAALLILTGYSTGPLRFASILGFIMTLFGLGVFAYIMVIYLTDEAPLGFPFLASIIAIFSGVQLFTLGIFGEYLARIFNRSMDRPPYVIFEKTSEHRS